MKATIEFEHLLGQLKWKVPVFLFVILLFFTVGDNGKKDAEVVPDIPEYEDLDTENLPASKHLDVPLRVGKGSFCRIQSLAMMVAFLDSTATIEEVFAYAGEGAALWYRASNKLFSASPGAGMTSDHHLLALQNYGIRFIIGAENYPTGYYYMIKFATGKLTYTSSEGAVKYLRAAIASGRPVQVHINMDYLPTVRGCEFPRGERSHFLVVSGYDEGAFYINEVTHPQTPESPQCELIRVPLEEFMEAWRAPGSFTDIFGWKAGPYWMLFFDQTSATALDKKSVPEILALHKEWSRNIDSVIEKGINSFSTTTNWGMIANVREAFGDYLIQIGNQEAGECYKSLANEYLSLTGMPSTQVRSRMTSVIRPMELEARTKY
jgi:hypothetical protein